MAEQYNIKQAAGRKALANALVNVAVSAGAWAEISTRTYAERSLWVEISTDHYGATVWIDGKRKQVDTCFIVPWCSKRDSSRRLSPMFGVIAGGTVNQYHGQKCTAVADNQADLLERVPAAVRMLVSGEAFA